MFVDIAEINSLPYAVWRALWVDYVGPAQFPMTEDLCQTTFARLCDATHGIRGLVAVQGSALGFAHFYLHPSTYSLAPACTLEDLYVAPEARGKGIAKQLISAVAQQAKADGAYVLHWKTREGNNSAIALYDKIAVRSGYMSFRMDLE